MSSEHTDRIEIEGDSNRQAHDGIKGYVYQIWHSVRVWGELQEDEYLVLEGAEDLDIYRRDGVETVGVRATSDEISLGRAVVRDAIKNYWNIKNKNKDIKISFRYLTTSNIGFERGQPFGGVLF